MSQVSQTAWQPITPRGVARFADASVGRLLLVQAVFAFIAGAAAAWCAHAAWFPTIRSAIERLPEHSEIRAGRVAWAGQSPLTLAEGSFLSVGVDLTHSGVLRGPAHVQAELGESSVRLISLFGYMDLRYPSDWVFALNRPVLEPWWGAWSPAILAAVIVGTCLGLMVFWVLLATVCCIPVWLTGFVLRRGLDPGGAWRLCGASPLLGSLFFIVALIFYGLGFLDPVRLLVVFGVHLLVAGLYSWLGVLASTKLEAVALPGGNPFAGSSQSDEVKPQTAHADNPFEQSGSEP